MVDKIEAPQVPDRNQPQMPPAREAIRAAIAEHKDKSEKQDREKVAPREEEELEDKKIEKVAETEEQPEVKPEKKEKEKAPSEEEITEPDDSKKKEEVQTKEKVEQSKEKTKAPFGIPKGIRSKWDNLDPDIQEYLTKTTKENLDVRAAEGRRTHLREVDQVLSPYYQKMQELGFSPGQVVKRLLDYTEALGNKQLQYAAIAKLANDYGIDLSVFSKSSKQQQEQPREDEYEDYIPPQLIERLDAIQNELNTTKSAQAAARQQANDSAALNIVNEWSGFDPATGNHKNKPYFPHVRQSMHSLIASGAVPFVNGRLDLDAAYEMACYANPEIRELMDEDRQHAYMASQEQKKNQQQQVATRAKMAASSLKPGAPMPNGKIAPKLNSKGQPLSVRDSILQAMHDQ